jgi:putative ABC transport system permease protein
MNGFLQDLKYALRTLTRSPGFAVVAMLTLALGIGANTAIFSVVDAVLLRPMPYPDGDRIVAVGHVKKGMDEDGIFSYPDYVDFRDQSKAFAQLGGLVGDQAILTGRGSPDRLQGLMVTGNFFDVLQAPPALGRGFAAGEDVAGKNHVVVLGHGTWTKHFGRDPSILGQTLTLDGVPYTVIGVLGEGFQMVGVSSLDFIAPMPRSIVVRLTNDQRTRFMQVFGRLAPGVSIDRARAELAGIADRLATAHPDIDANRTAVVTPLHELVVKDVRPALLFLLAAVALVLLIACANVANLLLARATMRHREIAIRFAVGASRGRVMRQMLTESTVLGLFGGAFGVGLALWGLDALRSILPQELSRIHIVVDSRVLAFTLLVSLGTGLLFGLMPAIHGAAGRPSDALKEGARTTGGTRHVARSILVASQVSVAMLLLIGAGLTLRSFARLTAVDTGFNAKGLMVSGVSLPDERYSDEPRRVAFYQALKDKVQAMPGVRAVAMGLSLPYANANISVRWQEVGTPPPEPGHELVVSFRTVNADYARALEIPIRRGRFFTDAEDRADGAPVAVVNEAFQREFFGAKEVIGKRIEIGLGEKDVAREIVGVVGDTRFAGLDQGPRPEIFTPYSQTPLSYIQIGARIDALSGFGPALRRAVESIDGDQPIEELKPMVQLVGESVDKQRLSTLLLGIFGAVGLALALIGVYGVMSYTVTQRVREIGVRIALGARPGDVTRMVVRQGLLLAVAGVVVGALAAAALGDVVSSMLFGVSSTDPLTYGVMAALLVAVTTVATWIPARRAARVDPIVALRCE